MEERAYTPSVDRLMQCLTRMPGVGRRSAERMVFHLLKQPPEEVQELTEALRDVAGKVQQCSVCCTLSESDPCDLCRDPERRSDQILVVEEPGDVLSMEATHTYRGRYHVLMGRLAPLEGVGPEGLSIGPLVERVRRCGEQLREVILGTSHTMEGDGTALHVAEALRPTGVAVTRLARGLPAGFRLEQASKAVLADAIEGRQRL